MQGTRMIDLRSPDATLSEYAQRYNHLYPEPSPQLLQRMDYLLKPDAPRLPRVKPAWLNDRPCTLSQDQALDRAQGTLSE
jgi:ADP-ribosyl-[dinitrogen reductase] hydrolase